ncbi:MAG: hypothetical protein H5T84_03285, partial [Thermoleophilia bacterium]|nr:hypothetical protein [Thermoleophilia bacterium]
MLRFGIKAWQLALLGFFVFGPIIGGKAAKGVLMANHFTPEELAQELGTGTR